MNRGPMRTTLDDDLAEALNRLARHSGCSFKHVVNDTLRRGLAVGPSSSPGERPRFLVEPRACGFRPGIDPLRLNQLLDQLETEDFIAQSSREGADS